MDPLQCPKRRKTDVEASSKQVDAHIRAFLNAVITSAQKSSDPSSSARDKLASVMGKALVKRRRNVPHCDASTQTEEDFIKPIVQASHPPPSPTSLLSENAAAYYASAANESLAASIGPSNTDLQYFASGSEISSSEVRQLLSNWMQEYEQWFYQNFGVDVNSVHIDTHAATSPVPPSGPPPPPPLVPQKDSSTDRAIACQTPFRITSEPVMYPQSVLYAPERVDPIASILSAQIAAQDLLSRYIITQQTHQQRLMAAAAAAAAASMAALPTPVVCLPPIKPRLSSVPTPTTETVTTTVIDPKVADSSELCGPVTQYGAYGILRPCPLDVMDMQKGNSGGIQGAEESLPIYITPEDYRNRSRSWMPPPPPTVLLLRKQALICVMQLQICKKAHEIEVRKATTTKTPVNIDYVAALESTVEKYVKVKVAYVFNRINRLPIEAQTPFICGLRRSEMETASSEEPLTLSPPSSTLSPATENKDNSAENNGFAETVSKKLSSNSLDVQEDDFEGEINVKSVQEEELEISGTCEEHSRAMYICDLLIGDVFVCQALADCKLQAKICVARKAMVLLSRANFLVGGVRTWHGGNDGAVDYLTLCLSPKADQVPQLTPFLADPVAPIPLEQPVSPGDPAEIYQVCNPKPFYDLWLYTALPIDVKVDTALTPEQFLAQSAEFSQMTVNFEAEFDSAAGVFTVFGLVDGQRCVKATALNVVVARANASSRLLRRLKNSQPVVGLSLPPPDPANKELAGPRIRDDDDSMRPLWGLTEASIVDTLMWGKHEKQFALPIEHLEAQCEIYDSSDRETDAEFSTAGSGFFNSRHHLEQYLEAYAASALVTPLRISLHILPHALWHLARTTAHSWGLLTCTEYGLSENPDTAFLLVCKRVPLPRLKRTLFERTKVGVFHLLSRGALPPAALRNLSEADLLDTESASFPPSSPAASPAPLSLSEPFDQEDSGVDANDPLTRMARTFHATAVKQETIEESRTVANAEEEDLLLISAEFNQPSNAVEILDDLPRQLIPGIDF